MHLHKLHPGKVSSLLDLSYVHYQVSELAFAPQPVWIQVLVRNAKVYSATDYQSERREASICSV
jgi:hypothetical protein